MLSAADQALYNEKHRVTGRSMVTQSS
jgi:hypothetical protein